MQKFSTRTMSLSAVMTALMCIAAPLSIPVEVVPVSLTSFIIMLCVMILGGKIAAVSCLAYILIGFVGLPVFSGFSGGAGKLLGPTGGYIIGYIFLAVISGAFADRYPKSKSFRILGMVIGNFAMYIFAIAWLSVQSGIGFAEAFAVGVIPFVIGDTVKIILAVMLGDIVKKRIAKR